jgi:allantoate deiminase
LKRTKLQRSKFRKPSKVNPQIPGQRHNQNEALLARRVMQRLEALGRISEEPGRLTRTFGSEAMCAANELVSRWMREAGMAVRKDAIGNLIGHYPWQGIQSPSAPAKSATQDRKSKLQSRERSVLLLGSHLDTVRDAGRFDGPLGVLIGIACVEQLKMNGQELPFAIEVVGFADEEGVRYQSTYLGSRAMAGTFNSRDLELKDANGITMAKAISDFGGNPHRLDAAKLNPKQLLGYVEVHIEQGPVLEREDLSVGVVTAISGQIRLQVRFFGKAGHAGTVPMELRRDALCAAAEFTLAVETLAKRTKGLVATVGMLNVLPGATNVIPGQATLTVDVRHPSDSVRRRAEARLRALATRIGRVRGVAVKLSRVHEASSVVCNRRLSSLLEQSVKRQQGKTMRLPSGAGHDAAAMAAIAPIAMLFVRCKGGISHHPAESVKRNDVEVAISVMRDFIESLAGHG